MSFLYKGRIQNIPQVKCWYPQTIVYDPIKAGSLDSTDIEPHDAAIARAVKSKYKPSYKACGNPLNTIFVGKLSLDTTEDDLEYEFSRYGKLVTLRLVRDIITGQSKKYAFIEYETFTMALDAYKFGRSLILKKSEIFVDFECGRTLPGWKPRRLGGGWGGQKQSGQLRFGGRIRRFKKPLNFVEVEFKKPPPVDREKRKFSTKPAELTAHSSRTVHSTKPAELTAHSSRTVHSTKLSYSSKTANSSEIVDSSKNEHSSKKSHSSKPSLEKTHSPLNAPSWSTVPLLRTHCSSRKSPSSLAASLPSSNMTTTSYFKYDSTAYDLSSICLPPSALFPPLPPSPSLPQNLSLPPTPFLPPLPPSPPTPSLPPLPPSPSLPPLPPTQSLPPLPPSPSLRPLPQTPSLPPLPPSPSLRPLPPSLHLPSEDLSLTSVDYLNISLPPSPTICSPNPAQ